MTVLKFVIKLRASSSLIKATGIFQFPGAIVKKIYWPSLYLVGYHRPSITVLVIFFLLGPCEVS